MNKLSVKGLSDLDDARREVTSNLRNIYSRPVISFEHGLCNRAVSPSCGIDHAHLHFLPTNLDVEALFKEDFKVTELERMTDLAAASGGRNEYLLLVGDDERMHIAFPSRPSSQYFRRRLAEASGRRLWNWHDAVLLNAQSDSKAWILNLHESWPEGNSA
jgi:hypothetical protein